MSSGCRRLHHIEFATRASLILQGLSVSFQSRLLGLACHLDVEHTGEWTLLTLLHMLDFPVSLYRPYLAYNKRFFVDYSHEKLELF